MLEELKVMLDECEKEKIFVEAKITVIKQLIEKETVVKNATVEETENV